MISASYQRYMPTSRFAINDRSRFDFPFGAASEKANGAKYISELGTISKCTTQIFQRLISPSSELLTRSYALACLLYDSAPASNASEQGLVASSDDTMAKMMINNNAGRILRA